VFIVRTPRPTFARLAAFAILLVSVDLSGYLEKRIFPLRVSCEFLKRGVME
jgi:hypothetical protein